MKNYIIESERWSFLFALFKKIPITTGAGLDLIMTSAFGLGVTNKL